MTIAVRKDAPAADTLSRLLDSSTKDIESIVRNLINSTEMLGAEEERRLILAWHIDNDFAARERLIVAHLKCVWGIARHFRRNNVSVADLIHEGVVGLITACEKFDPAKSNRFSTYAQWWVMTTLQEYMDRCISPVKVGKTRAEKAALSLLRKAKRRYGPNLSSATRKAIAEELDIPYEQLIRIETTSSTDLRSFSLNQTVGDDGEGIEFIDTLVDEGAGPEEIVERSLDRARKLHISNAIDRLSDRQKTVITKRFFTEPPATLKELADELAISPERVRQIQIEAMWEMRRILEGSGVSLNDLFGADL